MVEIKNNSFYICMSINYTNYKVVLPNYYFYSFQSQMGDPKTYKQHFESKHPKAPLPELLKGVAA